jgi:hypothetical protein
VTLRGLVAGKYTVNLYYYESQTAAPVTVTVQVDKVNAGLGIAALALTSTVMLLLMLINASVSRAWKIGSVMISFAALTLAWRSMIGVLGLPSAAPLPADAGDAGSGA